jgi:hypothetical protein
MARGALRPSAIGRTMSDRPRCVSSAVNTPGTLVIQPASRTTLTPGVKVTAAVAGAEGHAPQYLPN